MGVTKKLRLNKMILSLLACIIFSINADDSLGKEDPPPFPKPIAYWAFDEGSGTITKDSINSHNGTIKRATWSKDCVKENCLTFDGKDDEVEIPHHTRFNFWGGQGDEFTIVVLPDTQYYSLFFNSIFTQQTRWIADNIKKLNIKFVIHVGDLVNNNSTGEWKIAKKAMSLMDGQVPYLVVPGNHDIYPAGEYKKRDYKNHNTFFPHTDFEKYPWYGGHYPKDGNQNNYGFFTNNNQEFIVLGLNWMPNKDELKWANQILHKHKDKVAILFTHVYMDFKDHARTETGNVIYNELIKHHSNIVLVASGHILGSGAERRVDYINGQPVNQVLQNYQMLLNGGQGYLRYYTFKVNGNKIDAKTYSPYLDKYLKSSDNQFTLDYRKKEMSITAWIKTSEIKDQMIISKQSGTDGSFYLATFKVDAKRGRIAFSITNSMSKVIERSAPFPYADNKWHHLAGVYDGEAMSLYVDGKLLFTVPSKQIQVPSFLLPEGLINNTSIPIKLGAYDGPGWKFKGSMDEIKIFNKALSPDQIFHKYSRFSKN